MYFTPYVVINSKTIWTQLNTTDWGWEVRLSLTLVSKEAIFLSVEICITLFLSEQTDNTSLPNYKGYRKNISYILHTCKTEKNERPQMMVRNQDKE